MSRSFGARFDRASTAPRGQTLVRGSFAVQTRRRVKLRPSEPEFRLENHRLQSVPLRRPATHTPYAFHIECVSRSTILSASGSAAWNLSLLPSACATNAVVVSEAG